MRVKSKILQKIYAYFALICFVSTLAPAPGVFADTAKPAKFPSEFGTVRETFQGTSSKSVILIQDAHTNYDAQTSIRKLIDHFQKKSGINFVALEGGSGPLDLGLLRAFPDQKAKEFVMDEYVRAGELSGAETAAVVNVTPSQYIGIEDAKLYEENKKAFLAALDENEKNKIELSKIRADLETRSLKIDSPELRKLRTRKAEALADLAREQKIDIKKFSGLEQIVDALKEKLFQSEAQRALDREFQRFETLERISRLEATREDVRFSAPFLKEFKIDLKSAMKFYDLAFKRDQVLSDAVIASAAKQSRIIFITGGFHTDGIKQKLKQSGISYQVITPKISTVGSNENYLKVMRGEVSYAHPRNLENEIAAVGDDDAKIIMRRKLQEWRMRFSGVPSAVLPILDRQLGIAALAPNIQTAAHPLHQQFLDAASLRLLIASSHEKPKVTIADVIGKLEAAFGRPQGQNSSIRSHKLKKIIKASSLGDDALPSKEKLRAKIERLEDLKEKIEKNTLPELVYFGDKHGAPADLDEVIAIAKRARARGTKLHIIGHGDGFDRGFNNVGVWRIFRQLKKMSEKNPNIRVTFILGNHEVSLIRDQLMKHDGKHRLLWRGGMGGDMLVREFKKKYGDAHIEKLKELAVWMLENSRLYEIDEAGILHVHAGIPANEAGLPLIPMSYLDDWQKELEEFQNELRALGTLAQKEDWFAARHPYGVTNGEALKELFTEAGIIFHARPKHWLYLIGEHQTSNFLTELGVNGIVAGHQRFETLGQHGNWIFLIDAGDKTNDFFLTLSPAGLVWHFLGVPIEKIYSRKRLLSLIDEEIEALKASGASSLGTKQDALEWLGEDLWKEFVRLNKGSNPAVFSLQGTPQEIKSHLNPAFEKLLAEGRGNEYAVLLLKSRDVQASAWKWLVVADRVSEFSEKTALRNLSRGIAGIYSYELVVSLTVYDTVRADRPSRIYLEGISVGRGDKPALRGKKLMRAIFANRAKILEREFPGEDIGAHVVHFVPAQQFAKYYNGRIKALHDYDEHNGHKMYFSPPMPFGRMGKFLNSADPADLKTFIKNIEKAASPGQTAEQIFSGTELVLFGTIKGNSLGKKQYALRWIGEDLWDEFKQLNGGKDPEAIRLSGDEEEIQKELRAKLDAMHTAGRGEEYAYIHLNFFDSVYRTHKQVIVFDQVKVFCDEEQFHPLSKGNVSIGQFDLVIAFTEYEYPRTDRPFKVVVDDISIGKTETSPLRGKGHMRTVFSKLTDYFVRWYPGEKIGADAAVHYAIVKWFGKDFKARIQHIVYRDEKTNRTWTFESPRLEGWLKIYLDNRDPENVLIMVENIEAAAKRHRQRGGEIFSTAKIKLHGTIPDPESSANSLGDDSLRSKERKARETSDDGSAHADYLKELKRVGRWPEMRAYFLQNNLRSFHNREAELLFDLANRYLAADTAISRPSGIQFERTLSPEAQPLPGDRTVSFDHVALSLDGNTLILGSNQRPQYYYLDVNTGERVESEVPNIFSKLSPDGRRAVVYNPVYSSIGSFLLWDMENKKELALLTHNPGTRYEAQQSKPVCFSANGFYAAIRIKKENKQFIQVFETEYGKMISETELLRAGLDQVPYALSPDGKSLITTAGDRKPEWSSYDLTSGQLVNHRFSRLSSAVFSPDGQRLAITSDKRFHLYPANSREYFYVSDINATYVSFTKDGSKILATNSQIEGSQAVLMETETGNVLKTFFHRQGDRADTSTAVLHPSEQFVLTAGNDRQIRIWDIETGKKVNHVTLRSSDRAIRFFVSPDGSRIFAPSGGNVDVFRIRKNSELPEPKPRRARAKPQSGDAKAASLGSDGRGRHAKRTAAQGDPDAMERTLKETARSRRSTLSLPEAVIQRRYLEYLFAEQSAGNRLLQPDIYSAFRIVNTRLADIYDWQNPKGISLSNTFSFSDFTGLADTLTFSFEWDLRHILALASDPTRTRLEAFHLESGEARNTLSLNFEDNLNLENPYAFVAPVGGRMILNETELLGKMSLWKFSSFEMRRIAEMGPALNMNVNEGIVNTDGRYAVLATGGKIIIVDMLSGLKVSEIEINLPVSSLQLNADATRLLENGNLWDLKEKRILRTDVSGWFDFDGGKIIELSQIRDAGTGDVLRELENSFENRAIYASNLSFNGNYLGFSQKFHWNYRIWDMHTGMIAGEIHQPGSINAFEFIQDGQFALTGSGNILRVFNIRSSEPISQFDIQIGVDRLYMSPDGSFALAVDEGLGHFRVLFPKPKPEYAELHAELYPERANAASLGASAASSENKILKKIQNLELLKNNITENKLPKLVYFGDKHGDAEDLERIVALAKRSRVLKSKIHIIGHGDGFDRGSDNLGVWQAFQELTELAAENSNIRVSLLFGNHDLVLIMANLLKPFEANRKHWHKMGGRAVAREFREMFGRNNTKRELLRLALWMLEHFKLYEVDEAGILHVHAGIPVGEDGKPAISLEQLKSWQKELDFYREELSRRETFESKLKLFFEKSADGLTHRENLIRIFEKLKMAVLIRAEQWIEPMKDSDVSQFLAELGANAIMVGHDRHRDLKIKNNRVFLIDVGDARNTSHLILNRNGFILDTLDKRKQTVLSRGDFLKTLDDEIQKLAQGKSLGADLENPAAYTAGPTIDNLEAAYLELYGNYWMTKTIQDAHVPSFLQKRNLKKGDVLERIQTARAVVSSRTGRGMVERIMDPIGTDIQIWDFNAWKQVPASGLNYVPARSNERQSPIFRVKHAVGTHSAAISPNGLVMAKRHLYSHYIQVVNLVTGAVIQEAKVQLPNAREAAEIMGVSNDGKRLILRTYMDPPADHDYWLWDFENPSNTRAIGRNTPAFFAPDGERVVSQKRFSLRNFSSHVWDSRTGRHLFDLDASSDISLYFHNFNFNGDRLIAGQAGRVAVWDISPAGAGKKISGYPKKNPGLIDAVALSPDGKTAFVGDEFGRVEIAHVSSFAGKHAGDIPDTSLLGRIRKIDLTQDGSEVLITADYSFNRDYPKHRARIYYVAPKPSGASAVSAKSLGKSQDADPRSIVLRLISEGLTAEDMRHFEAIDRGLNPDRADMNRQIQILEAIQFTPLWMNRDKRRENLKEMLRIFREIEEARARKRTVDPDAEMKQIKPTPSGAAQELTLQNIQVDRSEMIRKIKNDKDFPVFLFEKTVGGPLRVKRNPKFYDPTIHEEYIEAYGKILESLFDDREDWAGLLARKDTAGRYFDFFALSDFQHELTGHYHRAGAKNGLGRQFVAEYLSRAYAFEAAREGTEMKSAARNGLENYRKFILEDALWREKYPRAVVMAEASLPERVVSAGEATWQDWNDPDVMILDDVVYQHPDWREVPDQPGKFYPGEKIIFAQWQGRFFLFYSSRSHTVKGSEIHQWRSTEEFTGGVRFVKNKIRENLDDARGELSALLDREIYSEGRSTVPPSEFSEKVRRLHPQINRALDKGPSNFRKFRELRLKAKTQAQSLGALPKANEFLAISPKTWIGEKLWKEFRRVSGREKFKIVHMAGTFDELSFPGSSKTLKKTLDGIEDDPFVLLVVHNQYEPSVVHHVAVFDRLSEIKKQESLSLILLGEFPNNYFEYGMHFVAYDSAEERPQPLLVFRRASLGKLSIPEKQRGRGLVGETVAQIDREILQKKYPGLKIEGWTDQYAMGKIFLKVFQGRLAISGLSAAPSELQPFLNPENPADLDYFLKRMFESAKVWNADVTTFDKQFNLEGKIKNADGKSLGSNEEKNVTNILAAPEYQKPESVMKEGRKILSDFSANSPGMRQTAIRLLAGKTVPGVSKEVQKLIDEAGVIPDEKVEAVVKNAGNIPEAQIPGNVKNDVALAVHIDSLPDELTPKAVQILSQVKKLILVFPRGDKRAERVVELVGRNVKRFPYVGDIPVQDIQRALEKERGFAKGFLTWNLGLVSSRLKTTREKISYFELDGRQYRETLAENALALILKLTQNPESIHEWQGVARTASLGHGALGISFDLAGLVERLAILNDSGKFLARAA